MKKSLTDKFLDYFASKEILLEESKVLELITGMLADENVQKLITPKTREYFLIDEITNTNVCIEETNIKISHGVSMANIACRMNFTEKIKNLMKEDIELERQDLKKQLFNDQINLLDQISLNYK